MDLILPKKRDARSLPHETLEEMRRLAVRRVMCGASQVAVARSLEVHAGSVWKWVAEFRANGEAGLASTKATGRPSKLSPEQQVELRRIIVGSNPRQLSFGTALWTLPIIRPLIERQFDVVLDDTNVSRMLHRMGLTPQKPTRRAFQRDDEECARWAKEEFPDIVRFVKRKQATLLFGDETGVHEDGPIGTTWGGRGERPVVRVSGTRRRVNVISAISPRGRLWFRCFGGTMNAGLFLEFLKALLQDVRGFVVLILDKHPAHVAAKTRRFLHEKRDRLVVHHLPSYAPDMNPDEHVWGYLKRMFHEDPIDGEEDFLDAVKMSMDEIKKRRELVRSFFTHPEVTYVREALKW